MTARVLVGAFGVLVAISTAGGQETERELRPRRLYFGAPPAAPHITQAPMTDCLACHSPGAGSAPDTPHPVRTLCTQCHVGNATMDRRFSASSFQGLPPPPRTPAEATGAPPRMAHAMLLHENCLTCHAPGAREAIVATPHPERPQCQACHRPQDASITPEA